MERPIRKVLSRIKRMLGINDVALVRGQGSLKVSGGVSFKVTPNPLASVALPLGAAALFPSDSARQAMQSLDSAIKAEKPEGAAEGEGDEDDQQPGQGPAPHHLPLHFLMIRPSSLVPSLKAVSTFACSLPLGQLALA